MSFTQMLEELETLTEEQREELIVRAMEIGGPAFTPEEEKLVRERIAEYHRDPGSGIPWETLMQQLRRTEA